MFNKFFTPKKNGTSLRKLSGKYLSYFSLLLSLSLWLVNNCSANQGSDLTELEWRGWPDFCRAAFAGSDWSKNSDLSNRVSRTWVKSMRESHNAHVGIPAAHHFCIGMVYVNRTKGTIEKEWLLKNAVAEIEYSFKKMTHQAPQYSLVTAYLGKAHYLAGNRDHALAIWSEGIKIKPSSSESYLAFAEALISEREFESALKLLLQFYSVKTSPNPEVEYFLGHIYFNLKQYDKARAHADKAYELGYTLQGLNNKLRKIGK